ncbi:MAG: bacteriohopanetetrol glucosamine biosynthesis glycosyltransferase HpnI [Acidobacteriota bacterium]|jgi:ceramide glucosyltransferase|nr:bacteriohopanetetrol glucosamine biosynthesis glycosyltransferase HpnI [Acidobacteriota bacterium]
MTVTLWHILQFIVLIPVLGGSVYALLCLWAAGRFRRQAREHEGSKTRERAFAEWPPVTILKPVCGVEKHQRENLRSACVQDYPEFQVVFSVQDADDPALPLLYELREEFGTELVTVAVENIRAGTNGKINNMIGGLRHARHDVLVISDSDVRLNPDYLKTIVAPLGKADVGCVCTFYKAARADTWYEKVELLTLNADFISNVLFAHASGASRFCLGASAAIRRSTLEEIEGFEGLSDYLVEDYEMGRRVWAMGKKVAIVPYFVDTIVDLKNPSAWWNHQIYWDQNTRAARPFAFFSTALIRSVPFAFIFAAMRLFDPAGLAVLIGATGLRLVATALILGWGLRDGEGLRCLWLLPFRDLSSLATWLLAFTKKTTVWRGASFILTKDGRLVARNSGGGTTAPE